MQAVRELNYRPHMAAAALRSGRTRSLALVVPYYNAITHVVQARNFEGAGNRAQELGYTLSVCTYDESENIRNTFNTLLRESRFDGAIIYGDQASQIDAREMALIDLNIPHVVLERNSAQSASVDFDNVVGGRIATEHLLKAGRRRIVFMGFDAARPFARRYEGYCAALAEYGLQPDPQRVYPLLRQWTDRKRFINFGESGQAAVEKLLADGVAFDGIVAATDDTAMAAIQHLARCGRRAPDDVAVIGFDDSPTARWFVPSLTSMYLDGVTMGRIAIDLLHDLLQGKAMEQPACRMITPTLVVRESCGAQAAMPTDQSDALKGPAST